MENFYTGENNITDSIVSVLRRDSKDKNALWVSDVGKCRRMIWYSWQNTPKTEKIDEVILKLNLGNFIHEGLSNTLKLTTDFSVLKVEWSEVSDGLPFGMRGRLDALVLDNKLNETYPIDWKSVMNFKFQKSFPKMRDVWQLQLYIEGLIKFYPDIKRGKIIYVDKAGAQKPVEVWVNRNPKILDKVKDEYVGLKDDKTAPEQLERGYEMGDRGCSVYLNTNWECKYCDYAEVCKPNLSRNKVASIIDGEINIRKDYLIDKDSILAFWDEQKYGGL